MSDTATVETLVAEVRTLMVGSRQVTLSVAKQLDVVPLTKLDVFGRVNLKRHPKDRSDYVIGAGPLGALSLSEYERIPNDIAWVESVDHAFRWCARSPGRGVWVTATGQRFEVSGKVTRSCVRDHPYDESCGWEATHPDADQWIAEAIVEHDEYVDRHLVAASAPLSVLAGLK